jgi:hypothetical protein
VESSLSSVDPSDVDESTLGGKKSDGVESSLSSVDPSDVDESLLSSVDPLSESQTEFNNIEHPSLLSPVDPLAYMIIEAGKTIETITKKINKIFI